MESLTFALWRVSFDLEATRKAYAATEKGGADECGCIHCRNLVAARDRVFPPSVLELFERLGVDPRRDVEVYEIYNDGAHEYYGWYHFVGRIESGPEGQEQVVRRGWFGRKKCSYYTPHLERVTDEFSIEFSTRVSLVHESFAGLSLVEIFFRAVVPWVLEEPDPKS